MILTAANKAKHLLVILFVGRVELKEIAENSPDLFATVAQLEPGFTILADFSQLEWMDVHCAPEIAKIMNLCAQKGVNKIIRVIPDPSKDIGFTILSRFHYPNKPRMIVCETLLEAGNLLSLA